MKTKKNYTLFILSILLLISSIILTIFTYHHFYLPAQSLDLTTVADPLEFDRIYSFSLIFSILCFLFFMRELKNMISTKPKASFHLKKLTQAGLCAALCYIGFAVFKIDIPVGAEKTAFHFGNVFCVLAALLIGGYWGGMAGAIGMTIGDLTTAYVSSAPKTFILKLCIGLITGFIAHKIFKLSEAHSKKYIIGATITACIGGMLFNVVADPLVGYFYKTYLLGIPQELASALAKMAAITTSVNAIVAIFAATILYCAIRPALKRSGLLISMNQTESEAANDSTQNCNHK